MSVAFRRESDEEHKEPRFELPVPAGPNLVTPRGYDLIKAQTEKLEKVAASALSDEKRAETQRDLRYWRTRLATAQLAPVPTGEAVAFGASVKIEQGGASRTFTIVGHDEADPSSGRIAFASPLAQALMGAEPGEYITAPNGSQTIRVVLVEPSPEMSDVVAT